MNQKAIKSLNTALSIARHLSSDEATSTDNLVFSPLSLNVAIGKIGAGASGPSRGQVLSFLKSDSIDQVNKLSSDLISVVSTDASPAGGPKVSFANGLWIQQGLPLKHSFEQVLRNVYRVSSYPVDFRTQAREAGCQVNSWVEKETNGLIRNILDPDSVRDATIMIMANALYFKGAWSRVFDESETQEEEFHLLGGNSVRVKFMTRKDDDAEFISKYEGFKVLSLPYQQGEDEDDCRQFSMCILLPDSKDGLPALSEKLGSDPGLLGRRKDLVPAGLVQVPRFKISFGFSASEKLEQMGVTLPFQAGGLSEMVDWPGESIDELKVYHKSVIEVNEEGTEAAAATSDEYMGCSMYEEERQPREDFVADHPFMFLLQEDLSGQVLFFGHVLNPQLQE